MARTLPISSAMLDAVLVHAAASPDEVCGLLLGAKIAHAQACHNVHPTPARHFEIDPAALLRAHRDARAGGPAVIGHYHSHPSGDPTPSATDAAGAVPDGSIWLIVAHGEARAWVAVEHGALHDRFDPVAIALT